MALKKAMVKSKVKAIERPRQNFSLQYQYSIKQTGDENTEKYQLVDY